MYSNLIKSSNSLRSFDFFTLPNGQVRIVFLGTQWNKFTQVTDLSYVDIDPLWRNHDLTNWKALLKPAQECPNQKVELSSQYFIILFAKFGSML